MNLSSSGSDWVRRTKRRLRKKLRYAGVSVASVPIGQGLVQVLGLWLDNYAAASLLTAGHRHSTQFLHLQVLRLAPHVRREPGRADARVLGDHDAGLFAGDAFHLHHRSCDGRPDNAHPWRRRCSLPSSLASASSGSAGTSSWIDGSSSSRATFPMRSGQLKRQGAPAFGCLTRPTAAPSVPVAGNPAPPATPDTPPVHRNSRPAWPAHTSADTRGPN